MPICDRCWSGRHLRCGGRNGCSCSVCVPRTARNPRHFDPIRTYKTRVIKQKVSSLPAPSVSSDEIEVAIRVLRDLPSILDHAVCSQKINFQKLGEQLSMSESIVRNVVKGRSKQGMTTMSLLNVLPWVAEALRERESTTA